MKAANPNPTKANTANQMTMNETEFLEQLALCSPQRLKFQNRTDRRIRMKIGSKSFCPITYLCFRKKKQFFPTSRYHEAAKVLGMNMQVAHHIAVAADGSGCSERTTMLKICKL